MSYDARVFNVMIASPGDVASERTIIRDVIYEWNAVHSKTRNIVLLPVGWESHSSPEMGGSPQEIINNQILDKCDFLVGVFWTRIGTPTNDFASGTVEEIELHIEAEKPAMLYFSSQPVVMDTVEPEQYAELSKFKKSCQSRSLYEGYDNYTDFKEKFYRHLQLKLNEHPLFQITQSQSEFSTEIVESNTDLPKLSSEARILLKETSLDKNGSLMSISYMNGDDVQTNNKNLIASQEPREVARWKSAVKELEYEDLIEDLGHKGEVFRITNLGYQIADMIEL
jgi:hypothetical protein